MDEDMFMVSVLENMNDEELEAFCYVIMQELDEENSKGEEKVCQ